MNITRGDQAAGGDELPRRENFHQRASANIATAEASAPAHHEAVLVAVNCSTFARRPARQKWFRKAPCHDQGNDATAAARDNAGRADRPRMSDAQFLPDKKGDSRDAQKRHAWMKAEENQSSCWPCSSTV